MAEPSPVSDELNIAAPSSPVPEGEPRDNAATNDPPPEKASQATAENKAGATAPTPEFGAPGIKSDIKELKASEVNFINIQGEIEGNFPGIKSAFRWFSLNDDWQISLEKQQQIAGLFVSTAEEPKRLDQILRKQHLLILSGEAQLGKATTALYLGQQLGQFDARERTVYLIPTLEQQVKIDFQQTCAAEGEFNNCLLIFKDAFAQRNRALLDFFAQFTSASLENFGQKLRQNNTYLIFTSVPAACATLPPIFRENHLLQELSRLERGVLLAGLDKNLAQLATEPYATEERLGLLKQHASLLVEQFKTLPRLTSYAKYFLRQPEAAATVDALKESMRRFDDLGYWFHRELSADFECWCFVFSLGLAHCLRGTASVTWFDFEQLRREVRQCFRRDSELFPARGRAAELAGSKGPAPQPALPDEFFLDECRAEILRDPAGLTEMIRFRDPSYPNRLWEIFLRQHRRHLAILLPRLLQLADFQQNHAEAHQRLLSAQLIGRCGELIPERISGAWLERCLESDDPRARPIAGALYQGILSSTNERYRQHFLHQLQQLSKSGGTGAEKQQLLTALSIHSQIGTLVEPAWVLNELKLIAERELVPVLRDGHRIDKFLQAIEKDLEEKASKQQLTLAEALTVSGYRELLRVLADQLYAQKRSTFVYTQYALSALCLKADPILVFRELRLWMEIADPLTGALVSILFLIENGIAARLEAEHVEIPGREGAAAAQSCNPLILALTNGPVAVREMANFLVTIYERFAAFPPDFRRYLRESFQLHLTNWVEESLPLESCRTAMVSLFGELVLVHQKTLFNLLQDWLTGKKFLRENTAQKQAFADDVLAAVRWR